MGGGAIGLKRGVVGAEEVAGRPVVSGGVGQQGGTII